MKIFSTLLLIGWAMAGGFSACADTLFFSNNQTANGIILRTNANDLLVLNDYGTVNWPRATITKVVTERADTRMAGTANELPNFKNTLLLLNAQPWAAKLQQIPATVIDQGVMKNVPYLSFRCGDDYEVNVYGDLDHPAAVEAGVYRKLLEDTTARSNCLKFISAILNQDADRMAVRQLDWEGAATNRGEQTLEITPPTAVDAYGGWWVSVYSTARLDTMRASDAELLEISTGKSDVNSDKESASWTAKELEFARPTRPSTITVKTSFGDVITNAEIVRVNEGVSLVWKSGGAGGITKLADLPEDVRNLFGYDEAKAAAAAIAEREKRMQQTLQDQRAVQQA